MSNEITRSTAEANRSSSSTDTASARRSNRRSFLKNTMIAGAATTAGAALLAKGLPAVAQESSAPLTQGDAAILRFLAAAEIIESDLWLQYQELMGIQDNE